MVVVRDQVHTIWRLPEGDADFATRWRLIKSAFSRSVATGERISDNRAAKGESGIWKRRYWEHTIRDTNNFAHHIVNIHITPSYILLLTPLVRAPLHMFYTHP